MDDTDRLIYEQLGIAAKWYTGVEIGLRQILARLLGDGHTAHAFADAVQPHDLIELIKKTKREAALVPEVAACLSTAFKAAIKAGEERNAMLHSAWHETTTDDGEIAAHRMSSRIYSRDITEPVSLDKLKKTNEAIYSAATVVGLVHQMLPMPEESIPFWVEFPDREAFEAEIRSNPERFMPRLPDTGPTSLWGMAVKTMNEVWGTKFK